MKLSVIIPTFNRADLLCKTLRSLIEAKKPSDFFVEFLLVDNHSTDQTRETVEKFGETYPDNDLKYLFEKRQGRSYAVNYGLVRATGDLVTMIDDDITIDENWYREIDNIFRLRWDEIDCAGGKILPNWETEPPKWVEALRAGVICWNDYGDEEWKYDRGTPLLTSGHSIIKRSVFDEKGFHTEGVGVSRKDFSCGEDDIVFDKLLTNGKRGIYSPKLVVHHYISAYRLTKSYYRQRCFGAGKSRQQKDSIGKPFEGAKLLGDPRWLYFATTRKSLEKIGYLFLGDATKSLGCENIIFVFLGYFYAANVRNTFLEKSTANFATIFLNKAER